MEWCQYAVIRKIYFKIGKNCFLSASSHILQLRTYSAFIATDIVLESTSDATCVVCNVTSFSHLKLYCLSEEQDRVTLVFMRERNTFIILQYASRHYKVLCCF